jgi:nucleotide-binding universal stress UspA family protein
MAGGKYGVALVLIALDPLGPNTHLPRAIWIARTLAAELIGLCVVRPGNGYDDVLCRSRLEDVVTGATISTLVRQGNPALELLRAAHELQPDLLIMGLGPDWYKERDWFGERVFSRYLLKSISAKVAQEAPCPVWLESPHLTGRDMEKALCVLGIESRSEDLVRFAANFSERLRVSLVLHQGVMSTKVQAPGLTRSAIERQSELVGVAVREIATVQRSCGTELASIIKAGEGLAPVTLAMKECGATLLIMDSLSNEWESNTRIYAAVRETEASVVIRRVSPGRLRERTTNGRIAPIWSALIIWMTAALGVSLIIAAMQSAGQADNCRLAPMRCNLPADFRFQPFETDVPPD